MHKQIQEGTISRYPFHGSRVWMEKLSAMVHPAKLEAPYRVSSFPIMGPGSRYAVD